MEKMYIPAILIFLSYTAVIYTSIYILIPKYIQSQKYRQYIVLLLDLIFVCTTFQEGLQYVMLRFFEPSFADGYYSDFNPRVIDFSSILVMDAFCTFGVAATVFLKH